MYLEDSSSKVIKVVRLRNMTQGFVRV